MRRSGHGETKDVTDGEECSWCRGDTWKMGTEMMDISGCDRVSACDWISIQLPRLFQDHIEGSRQDG